jgi:hypothetical protein
LGETHDDRWIGGIRMFNEWTVSGMQTERKYYILERRRKSAVRGQDEGRETGDIGYLNKLISSAMAVAYLAGLHKPQAHRMVF